jgi:hypothetical protein
MFSGNENRREIDRALTVLEWAGLFLIYLVLGVPAAQRVSLSQDGRLGVGMIDRRRRSLAVVSLRSPWPAMQTHAERARAGASMAAHVSPTVFREGPFRFLLFTRGAPAKHSCAVGGRRGEVLDRAGHRARAQSWAERSGLEPHLQLIIDHEQEIRDAWRSHFGS